MIILNERNGSRQKEKGKGKKTNGNGKTKENGKTKGNGYYKLGTCPRCEKENIPLTEHHIWKRSVWGPNDYTVFLCRDCHDELEAKVRIMENMVLRLFMFCYRSLYRDFMNKKKVTEEDIVSICLEGLKVLFKKIMFKNEFNDFPIKQGWALKRMQKKIFLSKKEEK